MQPRIVPLFSGHCGSPFATSVVISTKRLIALIYAFPPGIRYDAFPDDRFVPAIPFVHSNTPWRDGSYPYA